MKRNMPVEALRFLFILLICVWHFSVPFTAAGFLGVEFFFILAGVFLYKNATRESAPGIIHYSVRKISKFYFKYVLAVIATYIIFIQGVVVDFLSNWTHALMRFLTELLMLQGIGLFQTGLNPPLWFFSVLLFGGGWIYGLTRYATAVSIRFIFPVMVALYFSWCFHYGTTERLEIWEVLGVFPTSLFRGICEIAYGTLIGYVFFNYSSFFQRNLYIIR